MKLTLLLAVWLLLGQLATAGPAPYLDLLQARAAGQAAVEARAGSLGSKNLTCTFTNLTREELRLRVPPGLHFQAADPGAQDLVTYQLLLLVLAPGAKQVVLMRGFCMELHDYTPRRNTPYALLGPASRGLQPLSDSLQKYNGLAEDYGQMLVWAVSDRQPLYELVVSKPLEQGANNILRYVATLTGQAVMKAKVDLNKINNTLSASFRPSVRTFAKRVVVLYHSPTAQVVSLKAFGTNSQLVSVLFANRKLEPGVVHYTYGVNATVGQQARPVFFVRLLDATGQVLKEVRIDDATPDDPEDPEPATRKFVFAFTLTKPVTNGHFRVRLPNGTLVEDLGKEAHLPVGGFRFNLGFHHLYPPGTAFVVRLETEAGVLIKEQALANE